MRRNILRSTLSEDLTWADAMCLNKNEQPTTSATQNFPLTTRSLHSTPERGNSPLDDLEITEYDSNNEEE